MLCVHAQSLTCPTLCDPMDYSPPGSSAHGILQVRILELVAISYSKGSSQPRDRTQVSCIVWHIFFLTTEPPGKPLLYVNYALIKVFLIFFGGEGPSSCHTQQGGQAEKPAWTGARRQLAPAADPYCHRHLAPPRPGDSHRKRK